jgi:hypothetical protein
MRWEMERHATSHRTTLGNKFDKMPHRMQCFLVLFTVSPHAQSLSPYAFIVRIIQPEAIASEAFQLLHIKQFLRINIAEIIFDVG